jgi:hypothetical protein
MMMREKSNFKFITPKAYHALKDYMDFRADCGEKITDESWLIRDRWRTADMQRDKCGRLGLAKYPRKLKTDAIKKMIGRAWLEEGVRPHALPEGERRYEFKAVHGFSKFFQTRAQQTMTRIAYLSSIIAYFCAHFALVLHACLSAC